MKFMLVALVVLVCLQVAIASDIPKYYYKNVTIVNDTPEQINNMLPDVHDMYANDTFCCRQMAAYGQWYLANHGVVSYIAANFSMKHAWILANSTDGIIAIDMTGNRSNRIMPKTGYVEFGNGDIEPISVYYHPEKKYSSIYEICVDIGSTNDMSWWDIIKC